MPPTTLEEEWSKFLSTNGEYAFQFHTASYTTVAQRPTTDFDFRGGSHTNYNIQDKVHDKTHNPRAPSPLPDKPKHANTTSINNAPSCTGEPPKCEELYISTKTKVLYLNREITIHEIFWKIPMVEYWRPEEGVIKKQIKMVCKTPEEFAETREKLKTQYYYTENIIKQINNPEARHIKFKDERKISVGISKKDIINSRIKVKKAFYNCFVAIFRYKPESISKDADFREMHVKIFNTGKLEIPGIINIYILDKVKQMVLTLLKPFTDDSLDFVESKKSDNVLINSNFNCGYFVNREKLYSILKSEKYGIETAYDPCSYPGVKCKFYFNNELGFSNPAEQNGKIMAEDRNMKMSELIDSKKYTEVSFMIFRTGSCLIVGNCSEPILMFIYEFIKQMFHNEYLNISIKTEDPISKQKKTKIRKKKIIVSPDFYQEFCVPK